ncbi:MAG: glycine cleavage system protein H [Deltaproteobacteria bacterium]|nr:glycine cleavage system protein H [Deltaproteobacteria bacterium]MBW2047841.1 glycine cleavage system protein H [Deltaproteobacteria bacterium]MBW2112269.1 glycine cleavage system protein H [Deltaproteobacteria bacterium]
MTGKGKNTKRDRLGMGTSYRRGNSQDLGLRTEIGTVLGGQVWMVKPDKNARTANPCLWMASGVVTFKNCNNFYDCTTCKYDRGMNKKVEKGKQVSWQEGMRAKPSMERVCRHSLTRRIAKRSCAYDYECSTCDFDQFFEDVWSTKTKNIPNETHQVKGFDMPVGYYFHDGHTWARIESGGYIRVGMDDFSLKLLGEADAFDLPLMGKELDQGDPGWGLKRKGNLADVLSPVDGVIVDVNPMLRERPGIANREPYGEGWLFTVRTPDIKDTAKKLMAEADSLQWMNKEVTRLEHMIEEVAGPMAADGGFLARDIYGNLPSLGWDRLTGAFLRT